jgi:hypothetical protein
MPLVARFIGWRRTVGATRALAFDSRCVGVGIEERRQKFEPIRLDLAATVQHCDQVARHAIEAELAGLCPGSNVA